MYPVRRTDTRYGTYTWLEVTLPMTIVTELKRKPTGISVKFTVFLHRCQHPSCKGRMTSLAELRTVRSYYMYTKQL